jgi:hypothetical protein
MKSLFDLLTSEWFLPKAFTGLAVGFVLRVAEHYAYYKRKGPVEKLFLWSVTVLAQSICIGVPLAYITLGILIKNFQSEVFITAAAYMLPVLTGFIAVDLRQLIRRYHGKE